MQHAHDLPFIDPALSDAGSDIRVIGHVAMIRDVIPALCSGTVKATLTDVATILECLTCALPRIAFADDNKVKLASRDRSANWTVETVDPAGGAMPSLAYDNEDHCHIGYVSGGTLKYATRKQVV